MENKLKPWILFEAGSLAKGISTSRVCTFLIDLEPTDIENPLAQFNHTKPNKDGLRALVSSINSSFTERPLKEAILLQVFDTYWPQFEDKFAAILSETETNEKIEKRDDENILLEVLSSVRTLNKRMRDMEARESIDNQLFKENQLKDPKEIDLASLEKFVMDSISLMMPMANIINSARLRYGASSSLVQAVIRKISKSKLIGENEDNFT